MATGRANQLTKQVGKYLVAAELCRRGLIAATFTGNVPYYDVVASDARGRSILIQVKAIRSSSWQFDIRQFADMILKGKEQVFKGKVRQPVPDLICVFLEIADYGQDKFYIFPWRTLQNILIRGYKRSLSEHGGMRPRTYDSFHCMLTPDKLSRYRGNWELIENRLQARLA